MIPLSNGGVPILYSRPYCSSYTVSYEYEVIIWKQSYLFYSSDPILKPPRCKVQLMPAKAWNDLALKIWNRKWNQLDKGRNERSGNTESSVSTPTY
jgi:hypothetical protein